MDIKLFINFNTFSLYLYWNYIYPISYTKFLRAKTITNTTNSISKTMGRYILNTSSGARCVRYRRTRVAVYFNKLTLLLIIVSQWISGNKHRRQRYSSHHHAATQWPQSHSVSFPINLNCLDLFDHEVANKAFLRISQHPPKHPFFGRSERRVLARKWPFLKLITVLIARIWRLWRADVHNATS